MCVDYHLVVVYTMLSLNNNNIMSSSPTMMDVVDEESDEEIEDMSTVVMPTSMNVGAPITPMAPLRSRQQSHVALPRIFNTTYSIVPVGHRDRVTFDKVSRYFLDPKYGRQRLRLFVAIKKRLLNPVISLRHVEYLFTKYAPYRMRMGKPIVYEVKDPDSKRVFFFEPSQAYQHGLKNYTKNRFDFFCRGKDKFVFGFDDSSGLQVQTALRQLNLFKMAFENKIIDWLRVPENYTALRSHMKKTDTLRRRARKSMDTSSSSCKRTKVSSS